LLTPHHRRVLAREAAVIAAGSLAAYAWGRRRYGSVQRAGTIAFSGLVGAQLLHALTCRLATHGMFSTQPLPPNRPLTVALAISAALQIAIPTTPVLRRQMGLSRLSALAAIVSLAAAVAPYLLNQAAKTATRPEAGLRSAPPSALSPVVR
jgi:Ca2+-transporting ATPase